jgi:hypothetical protein
MDARRLRLAATGAAVVLAFAVACDGNTQTQPPPTSTRSPGTATTTTTTTTTAAPTNGAPRVTNPLDAETFTDKPCTSLTATQLKKLGLRAGFEGEGRGFDQSDWHCAYPGLDPAIDMWVDVNYHPDIPNGLSYRYKEHADGQWPRWKPTEIDGYPAVFYNKTVPVSSPGLCNVDVGISDSSLVNLWVLYWGDTRGLNACATATKVAQAILATIKAAT